LTEFYAIFTTDLQPETFLFAKLLVLNVVQKHWRGEALYVIFAGLESKLERIGLIYGEKKYFRDLPLNFISHPKLIKSPHQFKKKNNSEPC